MDLKLLWDSMPMTPEKEWWKKLESCPKCGNPMRMQIVDDLFTSAEGKLLEGSIAVSRCAGCSYTEPFDSND